MVDVGSARFQCEARPSGKQCKAWATAFVMGRHLCSAHDTAGAANCSHSLAPSGRCSYCGAHSKETNDA